MEVTHVMRSWLMELRKAVGYTQSEIATAVGISQPAYSNIENGERRPSPETAKALGNALGFDWTRFFQTEEAEVPRNES